MENELIKLIREIQKEYLTINDTWKSSSFYKKINMRKALVKNAYQNQDILSYAFDYVNFLNEYVELGFKFQGVVDYTINTRVKAKNSIQSKIEKYVQRKENGEIPLNKCLNDLFGVRIILEEEIDYHEINKLIKKYFPRLKCILAIRGDYQAIHIYFGKENSYNFQWELQIWDKKHERTNFLSHARYKQEYTKWEKENKEGDIDDKTLYNYE